MSVKSETELALRRNRARTLIPNWIERLRHATGFEVNAANFLPPNRTLRLKEAFVKRLKEDAQISRRNFPIGSEPHIRDLLMDASIDLRTDPLILFSTVDQDIGAVQLPAASLLANFLEVWKIVRGDFSATTPDGKDGLCVEVNHYDLSGRHVPEGVYEVLGWGAFGQISADAQ